MPASDYVYSEKAAEASAPMMVLFHGTGGDENQFMMLGSQLMPRARLVAPRGDVSERGAYRYFKRTGEGQYDMADLGRATSKMADFVAGRASEGKPALILGFGYSNGANILASVLFVAPSLFDAAVLLHPLIPFEPPPAPRLSGKRVLITAGRRDPLCPPASTLKLSSYFEAQGAQVSLSWHEGGHEIRPEEVAAAKRFIDGLMVKAG